MLHRYGKLGEKIKKYLDSIRKLLRKRFEKKIRGNFKQKINNLIIFT